MYRRSRLALSIAAAVGSIGVIGSVPATAQEAGTLEEVVVTGSRIRRTDIESISPISVFDEAALDRSGATTLERFLTQIPSVYGGDFGSGVNNESNGYSTASLRGLGPDRTLVLLDGQRLAPAALNGFADLNLIPSSLIERIEVLRDGASTIYGSDAIAGVINLITKTDFDGAELEYQYDETGEGDGQIYMAAATLGKSFDRGNVVINAQWTKRDPIWQKDRNFSECALGEEADGSRVCIGSPTPYPANIFRSDPDDPNSYVVDGTTGQVRPFGNEDTYNFAAASYLVTPQEVYSFYGAANYDLIESSPVGKVSANLSTLYANRESDQLLAADGTFWAPLVPADNPYNPFGINRADFGNPGTPEDVYIARRMAESGGRGEFQDANQWRIVAGLNGVLNNGWAWDIAYNRSDFHDSRQDTSRNLVNKIETLLDPTACAADPGCPGVWDPFNQNTLTPEMLAYAQANPLYDEESKLRVFQANLTGDMGGFELPGGEIQWAIGYEDRETEGSRRYDALALQGEIYFYPGQNSKAEYQVDEWYGELRLPILSGAPFAEVLTAEVSTRISDYDYLDDEEDVWKYALEWAPVRDIRFRYVYAEGFRAPNVAELADPERESANSYSDPCKGWDQSANPTIRANCAADGIPPNLGSIQSPQANTLIGGNPNLEPEESESKTFGIVWTPSFLEELSVTLDWYNIEIKGAIGSLSVGDIITSCYNSDNFSAASCALILGPGVFTPPLTPHPVSPRRQANGTVAGVDTRLGNLNSYETEGYDFSVNYTFNNVFEGMLNLSVVGTYLDKYEYTSGPGFAPTDLAGYYGTDPYQGTPAVFPEWKANFNASYSRNNWGGNYTIYWLGEADDVAGSDCGGAVCDVSDYYLHDVQGYYEWKNFTFTLGVRNLFDEEPPYVSNYDDMNTINYNYDTAGRYFYGRISASF